MYLGLRIAELKTQLQLNELARDWARGEGRGQMAPRRKVQKKNDAGREWRRMEEVGQEAW